MSHQFVHSMYLKYSEGSHFNFHAKIAMLIFARKFQYFCLGKFLNDVK